jgi:hypothetical protein
MGGRPKVYGGMSQAEYNSILERQARISADAEAERQKNLLAYETERRLAEQDQIRFLKEAERLAIMSQKAAEEETAKELQAQTEEPEKNTLSQEESERLKSMFGSLYSGTIQQYLQKPQG